MHNMETLVHALLLDIPAARQACKPNTKKSNIKSIKHIMHNRRANRAGKLKQHVTKSVLNVLTTVAADKSLSTPEMMHPNLATSQEHVQRMELMHRNLAKALNSTHLNTGKQSNLGRVFVPVCTVDMDNEQLCWGRDVPLCTAGQACVATRLAHAPGPLHAFTSELSPTPSLCLLCIRLHAQMINKATLAALNVQASLMPPFTNLVNCAGGYHDWALGVNTSSQRVFSRQCAIVGACPNLKVRYSPLDKKWWVDQSDIVWQPPDFRQGVQTLKSNSTMICSLPGTV